MSETFTKAELLAAVEQMRALEDPIRDAAIAERVDARMLDAKTIEVTIPGTLMPPAPVCENCNAECEWADTPGEPCWGRVEAIDEDLVYDEAGEAVDHTSVHACEGHAVRGKYVGIVRPLGWKPEDGA